MAKVADLLVSIGADIKDFQNSMKRMKSQMKNTGKELQSVGQGMSAGLSAPIAGIGTAMVATAAKFEGSMNKVKAISGATGKDFNALRDQAKELGSTTKFSASEAADGMSYLAMAGFETKDIMGAMPGMLDMAAASGMKLADAADIASNIMSGFGIEAQNASHVSDVLAKTASSANTDVSQLGEAMKYAAPVADSLGLSMEDTAAAIGFMSDAGIQGSMAGTALRGGLTRLAKPTGKAKALMNQLGIEVFDSQGKMKSMQGIVKTLNSATEGMTKKQKAAAISTIFGQEAMSGWLAVMGRGSEELGQFSNKLVNSDGSAKKMAETMNAGLTGAIKTLQSSLEGLAIEFGEILLPVITKVAEKLTALVRWFSGLSDTTKLAITIIAGLVAAIGPLLVVIGTLMTVLGSLTAPIVAVVAITTTLITTFGVLMAKSETFQKIMKKVWTAVKNATVTIVSAVKNFLMKVWGQIKSLWKTHGDEILSTTKSSFETIKRTVQTVIDVIKKVITTTWEDIKSFWQQNGEEILANTKASIQAVRDFIQSALTRIKEFWKNNGQSILNSTMSIFNSVKEFLMTTLEYLWTLWQDHGQTLVTFLKQTFNNIFTTIESTLTLAWNFISDIIETLTSLWNEHGDWFMKFIGDTFMAIFKTISDALNKVWSFVNDILTRLNAFWRDHGDSISKIVKVALDVILTVVKTVLGTVKTIISTVLPQIKNVFATVWDVITTIVKTAIDVIIGIITMLSGVLTGDFSQALEGLIGIARGIWNGIKGIFKAGANSVIRIVNGMISAVNGIDIDIPSWVPGFGGKSFGLNIPKIPMLAEGGVVTGPTLAMIGEGKEDEAVLPLSKLGNMMGNNGKSQTVVVELDGRELARGTLPHMENEIRLKTGLNSI